MIKHSVLRLNGESEVRSDLPHSQWHSDSDGGFHVALINLQHELDNRLIFPFLSIIKISSVRIGGISWFRNEYDEWWKTHTHQNHRIRWFFFYPRPVSLSYSLPLVLSSKLKKQIIIADFMNCALEKRECQSILFDVYNRSFPLQGILRF